MEINGVWRVGDGSTSAPSLAFRLDTNTGLYRPGTDRLRIVTGGTDQWEVDASGNLWPVPNGVSDIGKIGNAVDILYANHVTNAAGDVTLTTSGGSWAVDDTTGHWNPGTDNALDIGPNRQVRDIYLDGTLKGAGGEPVSYTPALTATTTNPTLGAGSTAQGYSVKVGRMVDVWGSILFGTGAASGTGNYRISIPYAPSTTLYQGNRGTGLGIVSLFDSSSSAQRYGFCRYGGATFLNIFVTDPTNASVATTDSQVAATVPWTWADTDELHWALRYITAL